MSRLSETWARAAIIGITVVYSAHEDRATSSGVSHQSQRK